MFPILRLPLLALQSVADNWTPFELYLFSLLSRRAKTLAKSVSRRPITTRLCYGNRCYFNMSFASNKKLPGNIPFYESFNFEVKSGTFNTPIGKVWHLRWTRINENPNQEVLKWAKDVMEVFRCPVNQLFIHTGNLNSDFLNSLLRWLNSLEQLQIPYVRFICSCDLVNLFLQRFPKEIGKLQIESIISRRDNPHIFTINNRIQVNVVSWKGKLILKRLYALDFVELEIQTVYPHPIELNQFMKRWKEGRAGQRMKRLTVKFFSIEPINELRDEVIRNINGNRKVGRKLRRNEDGKMARVAVTRDGRYTYYRVIVE